MTKKLFPILFVFTFYIFFVLYTADYSNVSNLKKLENLDIDCDPVINGTENGKKRSKAEQWTTHTFRVAEEEIYMAKNVCQIIHKYFVFNDRIPSKEEADYPLAFGLLVYKDIIQVLLQLSLFYLPHHQFCITVDLSSPKGYKRIIRALPSCFPNMKVFTGDSSEWGSFGILSNVYTCFKYLTELDRKWEYYQYLSGTDLPLRTNLEMVRIFKALNGSANIDSTDYEIDRYKNMAGIMPPLPIYKSSMSVSVPRSGANYIVRSAKVVKLLQYLRNTWIPDEAFWATVFGSPALLPVPGSVKVRDILWLRKHFKATHIEENSVTNVGSSYIGRYQVWEWQKPCYGMIKSYSCVFGVGDMEEVARRPELVAHKIYLDFQPAAYMCLFKEIRKRSKSPTEHLFSAKSYGEMPTVELHNGKSINDLTHPEWLKRDSFYDPNTETIHENFF